MVYQNSVLPFIDSCRAASGVDNPSFFYSMDGEQIQLRNFIDCSKTSGFSGRCCVLAKHCASLSASSNALDTGNIHKSAHKVAKCATDQDIHWAMEFNKAKLKKSSKISELIGTMRDALLLWIVLYGLQ
jgi:hypothetical protein